LSPPSLLLAGVACRFSLVAGGPVADLRIDHRTVIVILRLIYLLITL
jgi:hypothetical protein